ncbi:hypothetical protein JW758_05345 [Candidatus Peregrinibacteria bacterium]|nr:hypothetical protein [Candidatus Peregrinibacteria bacterium]
MNENNESTSGIDIEALTEEFKEMVEIYAKTKYITFGRNADMNDIKRREELHPKLLDTIIDFCADAMLKSGGSEEVLKLIRTEFLNYRYGGGSHLLPPVSKVETLEALSQRIAQRAATKNETAEEVGIHNIRDLVQASLEKTE